VFIAEQFAFEQLRRDRGAVDLMRLIGPRLDWWMK